MISLKELVDMYMKLFMNFFNETTYAYTKNEYIFLDIKKIEFNCYEEAVNTSIQSYNASNIFCSHCN